MNKLKFLILVLIAAPAVILTSCKDDDDTAGMVVRLSDQNDQNAQKDQQVQMTVKMTDAPAAFMQVNVEILQVSVHYGDTTESGTWVDLPTNAGIYDLLTLQDSLTVVLADANGLPTGEVSQIRLLLGDENTVLVDSVAFPLITPSGQQTGIKINLDYTLQAGFTYEVLLDFDAEQSVVIQGNGSFLLKPVIRVESILELESGEGGDLPPVPPMTMSTYDQPENEN